VKRAQAEDQEAIRGIGKSFLPVVFGRGVAQISAYIDNMIASLLPTGAVSSIAYAQTLYLLPISLFGMSVSAAELPELSSVGDADEAAKAKLRQRLEFGLARISFFVIPSAVAFALLGDMISGLVFQTGEFKRADSLLVWAILAAASLALLPATRGRLISSTFYALRDTKTPLRFSLIRVVIAVGLGLFGALKLPGMIGTAKIYGTVGLTAASGIAGWVEFILLKRSLEKRIGQIQVAVQSQNRVWIAALLAGVMAFALKIALTDLDRPILVGGLVLGFFGVVYFIAGALLGVEESKKIFHRFGIHLGS